MRKQLKQLKKSQKLCKPNLLILKEIQNLAEIAELCLISKTIANILDAAMGSMTCYSLRVNLLTA